MISRLYKSIAFYRKMCYSIDGRAKRSGDKGKTMAQPARAYTPSLLANDDDVFDETNPSTWAYHVRVKREKETCEYTGAKLKRYVSELLPASFLSTSARMRIYQMCGAAING